MASRSVSRLVVSGFPSCPYFQGAKEFALSLKPEVRIVELEREQYHLFREKTLGELKLSKNSHKTCPLVYIESNLENSTVPTQFIGGFDALRAAKL